ENIDESFLSNSKKGYIYILINESMSGILKIGRTSRDPKIREKELSRPTGVPTPFNLVYQEYFHDSVKAESIIHNILEDNGYRLASNREFFTDDLSETIKIIQSVKTNYIYNQENNLSFENDNDINYLMEEGRNYLQGYGDIPLYFEESLELLEESGELNS